MTEQRSGLRFDIYERVHLPEGLAGIGELDEAELIPHIQVIEEKDYAVIKGNLWLAGKYIGESGEQDRGLEHLIPVEITMPLARVDRLDEVRVEIDQFDIELLSPRSLNVTGVLSLHGIELPSASEQVWEDTGEEEVLFVHQLEERLEKKFAEEVQKENPWFQELDFESEALETGGTPVSANYESDLQFAEESVPVEQPEWEQPALEASAPIEEPAAEEIQLEEKQDLRVGIAGKGSSAYTQISHLKSIAEQQTRKAPVPELPDPAAAGNMSDSLEWKKLFIRDDSQSQFKRMRICIVQKEETLEQIAERYRMNPREILLHNRIAGQQIGEGQIIYIPNTGS